VIALALLHPRQVEPVHCWTFDRVSLIRIGRSLDNDVILYSAVISRHHLELHRRAGEWWAINRGKNGTYLDDVPIKYSRLVDKTTLCLAKSGPRLRISFADHLPTVLNARLSTQTDCTRLTPTEEEEEDLTIVDVQDLRVESVVKPWVNRG